MRFKDIVLRFFNSFERSKQTNDLSEKQLDSFILRLFNEIIKEDKDKSENFDEIIFLQKFDRELKRN